MTSAFTFNLFDLELQQDQSGFIVKSQSTLHKQSH